MRSELKRLFHPRSIAIIGASQDLATISGQPLKHLTTHGYAGTLYPVNPRYAEITGVKCWPSVSALPAVPDLALILINANRAADALRECGRKGVPFVIVFTSGYSETGGEGVKMQQELIAIAREYNIGIVGPNCQGMISVASKAYAGFGSVFNADYEPGVVSMVSQSGGFGFSVMNLAAMEGGVNFRQMVTTGNEIGISTLDFIDYFCDEPETELIAVYIEGLKDAYRLPAIADKALDRKKPILCWKVGNTEQGQRAAASHTANLGGEMALYRSVIRDKGLIQVEDIQDVVDIARAFASGKLPKGNGLAIVTISGGAGILMTDAVVEGGMQVPSLAPATLEKLKPIVPSFGSLNNPIDLTAAIFNNTALIQQALQPIVEDPNVHAIAIINASLQGELAAKVAAEIVKVANATDKPFYLTWSAIRGVAADTYAQLDAARLPYYQSPVRCGRAIAAVSYYAAALRRHAALKDEQPLALSGPKARVLLGAAREDLTEYAAKQVLAEYGIGVTLEALATTREAAAAAAKKIGFPVVLKVSSPDIPHKTEANAVRLGIGSEADAAQAFDDIVAGAKLYNNKARIEGVLVQEMVKGGVEAILGVTNDPLFGPAVMFGLGGIFAEVMKDVAFRLAPVTRTQAMEMIREIKGYPILAGARGKPPCDIDALADTIERLSALAVDLKDSLGELDINPLFVFPKGRGVKAADALIKPKQPAT